MRHAPQRPTLPRSVGAAWSHIRDLERIAPPSIELPVTTLTTSTWTRATYVQVIGGLSYKATVFNPVTGDFDRNDLAATLFPEPVAEGKSIVVSGNGVYLATFELRVTFPSQASARRAEFHCPVIGGENDLDYLPMGNTSDLFQIFKAAHTVRVAGGSFSFWAGFYEDDETGTRTSSTLTSAFTLTVAITKLAS